MGFNIAIHADNAEINFEGKASMSRDYYYFVEGYSEFREDSALIQLGIFFGLYTSPLGRFSYVGNEMEDDQEEFFLLENEMEESPEENGNSNEISNLQDVDTLIDLVQKILQGVTEKPEVFQKIDYALWNEDLFEDYAISGLMLSDLTCVLQSLQFYKDKGCKSVYFVAI